MSKKAVVLFSGGVDSTTCLAMAIKTYGKENVIPLSIFYGQKHDRELQAAKDVLAHYGIKGKTLDLSTIFADSKSTLLEHTHEAVPTGTYKEQQETSGNIIVSTYVPFRNGLFLSAATSMALSLGADVLYYGAHADDAAGNAYSDCTIPFYTAMGMAISEGTGGELRLEAPFISSNKADVVKEGLRLGVPYELTWSCYVGQDKPCHKCGTCIDREEAFRLNGIMDPLLQK